MEGGKFLQQLSRQQHFLIQQQQHGLSWLTSLWSKGIIQVVNNIHCTWETPIFLFNYFNKVYDMTIIRQSIRSFNIPPGNSRKFDCHSCQRLGIWTLSGGGWGIWTGNVKSFQPNKRVSVKEFKDRATTLRGETEESRRSSYIPFNSLVHIVLFLSLSVEISMNWSLRSFFSKKGFCFSKLDVLHLNDELHVLSSEQQKVSSWLMLF